MQIKNILFLLTLFFSVATNAQTIIKSNDPGIRYDLIKPGHVIEKVTQFDTLGNSSFYLSNNYIIVDKNTHHIALVRSAIDSATRIHYWDTSWMAAFPISMHSLENPAHKELKVKFEPTAVTVRSIIDGKTKTQVYEMKEGYFDDNIVVDIMGYFPIKKNIRYSMEAFRYESVKNKGVSPYEMEYLHDDYLTDTGKTFVLCKVIYYKTNYCNGYSWYDKSNGKLKKSLIYIGKNTYLINYE